MSQDHPSSAAIDDPAVIAEIDRYQQLPTEDRTAARRQLLARFPDLADDLSACLKGLDLMSHFGPQLAANLEGATSGAAIEDGTLRTLGDFRLIEEIGRGGMGVVYLAEQISLGRKVALKVLPFAAFLDSRCLQRFKQEAQAAAMLRHPNIVNVHCVGCERGVHYYAMELVEGESLLGVVERLRFATQSHVSSATHSEPSNQEQGVRTTGADTTASRFCRETSTLAQFSTQYSHSRSQFFRGVARSFIQIADAIHYAHEQGVVHRDLKPSNLLLDVRGHAWVTDFGLAQVQGDRSLTFSGDLLGTLRYMSPEQAEGRKLLDHRTDVYSLGATLYELLTLRPLLDGNDRQKLLLQLERHEAQAPRSIDTSIPKDLETIVLKAVALRPEDRYESAAEMAADLRRFVENRPVMARRVTRFGRVWRWVLRHRLVATLTIALVLMLLALSIIGPVVAIRYARLAADEASARQLADANRQDLQQLLNNTLTKTAESLGDQPGLCVVQRQLLEEVARYYERLRKRSSDSPSIQREAARAYLDLAQVSSLLAGQPQADPLYARAIEILASLVEHEPDVIEYQRALADARAVSGASLASHDLNRGLRELRDAVTLMERLLLADATDIANARQLIVCRILLGYSTALPGALDDANRQLSVATRSAQQLHEKDPGNEQDAFMCAYAQDNLAAVLQMQGRFDEAEDLLRRSLATYEDLAEWAGTWVRGRSAYGDCKQKYSAVLNRLKRHPEAEVAALGAIEHVEAVLRGFPAMEWMQAVGDEAYAELAVSLAAQGRLNEAENAVRSGLRIWDVGDKQRPMSRQRRGLGNYRLGLLKLWQGDDGAARQCFEASLLLLTDLEDSLLLARILSTCPVRDMRKAEQGVVHARRSLHPQDPRRWQTLGIAQFRHGDPISARRSLLEAVRRRPNGDAYDYFFLAMCSHQMGDTQEAAEWYRKAREYDSKPLTPVTFCLPMLPCELDDVQKEAEIVLGIESGEPEP